MTAFFISCLGTHALVAINLTPVFPDHPNLGKMNSTQGSCYWVKSLSPSVLPLLSRVQADLLLHTSQQRNSCSPERYKYSWSSDFQFVWQREQLQKCLELYHSCVLASGFAVWRENSAAIPGTQPAAVLLLPHQRALPLKAWPSQGTNSAFHKVLKKHGEFVGRGVSILELLRRGFLDEPFLSSSLAWGSESLQTADTSAWPLELRGL